MPVLLGIFLILILASPSLEFANLKSHSNLLIPRHLMKDNTDSGFCLQDAVCVPLQNATCYGTTLPYTSTSIALAEDSITQYDVQDNLALWQGLRSVPRCWAVVQPLLCAVYKPKCENGSVYLPSQEMCRITRDPCKSVEVKDNWPSFLRCENKKLFPPKCKNPLQEVKFNVSYKCVPPLVETDIEDNWYHEVKGCGIQCQDPLFTTEEHDYAHDVVKVCAPIAFFMNAFTVLTFVISWKTARRYPGKIIFFINLCLAVANLGWMIQFIPSARNKIVCTRDGTIRRNHPRAGEHLCSITCFLTYFFLVAALAWFVILAYSWHISLKQAGYIWKKKTGNFHICSWCPSSILTVIVMGGFNMVDGDSISGICFVGHDVITRIVFLLIPIGVAAIIAGGFLISTLITIYKLKLECEGIAIKKKEKECLDDLLVRIGFFSMCSLVLVICTVACHAYDFMNRQIWDDSLRDYIVCLAMNSAYSMEAASKCSLNSKPNIKVACLNIFCFFAFGVLSSSWIWRKETFVAWQNALSRISFCSSRESLASKRQKFIGKAQPLKPDFTQCPLSFSVNSSQDDPVGRNLDAKTDIALTFDGLFPQFFERKSVVPTGAGTFAPRHYSSASDMSRHHRSMDSFNQINMDSLSLQISEQDRLSMIYADRHQRRKTRRERERFLRANQIAPWFPGNRRGSDTSLQSSLMAAAIAAAKKAGIAATVTKATSTGDLEIIPIPQMIPPQFMIPPVNNRPSHIQRQAINHPFTHGMTDNSHHLDSRVPSIVPGVQAVNPGQRFIPSQCSVVPNSGMALVRQPMYGGSYDVLNSMSFNYFAGNMYPSLNNMYPGYQFNPNCMYNPYAAMQYPTSFTPCSSQYQQDILPMNPRADSISEAEYFPIGMSDSEYTDTGMRSYDEFQLMTTQKLQEHLRAQAAAAASTSNQDIPTQPKPGLEPQECAKTQFLKRMGSFQIKTNSAAAVQSSRPPSGRKSSHSEAPPPSPVGSDNVFDDEPEQNVKNSSRLSLGYSSDIQGFFRRIKSKFTRSNSFAHGLEKPENLELTSKPISSSLIQLSRTDSFIQNGASKKSVLKEKCLDPSEGTSLMTGDLAVENVSR